MRGLAILALAVAPALLAVQDSKKAEDTQHRIDVSAQVFDEIMRAPDHGIPHGILDHARCIGIIPATKRAGFIVGVTYGKGVMVCRDEHFGGWSGPSAIRIEGGSFGAQIGAGETDLVFVVMNSDGMHKLMQDKFEVGADASVMGGPLGRTAQANTDAEMHAEILAYSRARGVFAGVTLTGATLRPDQEDNDAYYGHPVTQREILEGHVRPPRGAHRLTAMIDRWVRGGPREARR